MDEVQTPVHSYTNITVVRAAPGGTFETVSLVLAETRTGENFAAFGQSFDAARRNVDELVAAYGS